MTHDTQTQIDDGGPAFPCETYGLRNGKETTIPTNGMTLRDWFAGQCDPSIYNPLDTLQIKSGRKATMQELAVYIANIRLMEADAMLAARKQHKQH